MNETQWLIGLYALAFALEALGIGLVVLDIRADLGRAKRIGLDPQPRWRRPTGRPGPMQKRGPNAGIDTEVIRRERDNVRAAEEAHAVSTRMFVELLTGNARRRVWGVGLIVTGLLLGTIGNVWSLFLE